MVSLRCFRIASVGLFVGTLAAGCVTTREEAGTFTTGGSGAYGGASPGSERPPETTPFSEWFGGKKSDPQKNAQLHLAYAMHEESRGNAAAARNESEEQRASYAAARKSYQQVLTLNEKSVDAVIGLARLDEVAGRIGDAEQGFEKAVRMESSSPRSLDALGQFYANQERWAEALPTLQRAVNAAPDDKAMRYNFGIALAKAGQIDQARTQLVDAVGSANAHYNLGVILHGRGDLAESEEEFTAALLDNPRLEPAQKWLADVRRERSDPSTPTAAPTRDRRTAIATAGHSAAGGISTESSRPPRSSPPRANRPAAPAVNPPRRIQQTAGGANDPGPDWPKRPSAPVSPLPLQ